MPRFSWRLLVLATIVLALWGAAACGGDGSESPSGEQVLYANLGGEPGSLDPQRASDGLSITVLRALYSGLLRLDEDLEPVAELAEDVPTVENGGISEDGLTYTFRLREGLKWSDGTPLVAQAFVDGARHLFAPGSGNDYVNFYRMIASDGAEGDANEALERALGEGVEGAELNALEQAVVDGLRVEAPDERTVVYDLNRQSPVFLLLASLWPMSPIRQDILDSAGEGWTEAGTLVSNGPFRLAGWEHSEEIVLERNEHWHGGEVGLQTVDLGMIADSAVAFLAYQNDELDMMLLGPAEIAQVRGDEALREQFLAYPQLSTVGVYFNHEDALFSDVRARQAFAGAFDRREYAEVVREGAVLPAWSWIPPGMPGYDDEVGQQFEDAVDESGELLAAAGAEGARIAILSPESSAAVQTAEWLKEQWEANLGVTVDIDVLETTSFLAARQSGRWQVQISGWGADYPDPQNWLPQFRMGAGLNVGRYSNAEFDRLIEEAERELDQERRIELYMEAQTLLIDEVGVAPLFHASRAALVKPWVQGEVTTSMEGQLPGDLLLHRIFISERP